MRGPCESGTNNGTFQAWLPSRGLTRCWLSRAPRADDANVRVVAREGQRRAGTTQSDGIGTWKPHAVATTATASAASTSPRRRLTSAVGESLADLAQPREACVALMDEALDALEDVVGIEVRLGDHLLDRAAGAPAVVPVGRQ